MQQVKTRGDKYNFNALKDLYSDINKIQEDNDRIHFAGGFKPCTYQEILNVGALLKGIKFFADRKIKNQQELLQIALDLQLEEFQKE